MTIKLMHIFISLFLLISTSGVSLNMHYCSGSLIDITLTSDCDQCCDEESEPCCVTDQKSYETHFIGNELQRISKTKAIALFFLYHPLESDKTLVNQPHFEEVKQNTPVKVRDVLTRHQVFLL